MKYHARRRHARCPHPCGNLGTLPRPETAHKRLHASAAKATFPKIRAALALDRKKSAAFSAPGGEFLRFPIGDRRCNRTRASVGNAGENARQSLTNATLAASIHQRAGVDG